MTFSTLAALLLLNTAAFAQDLPNVEQIPGQPVIARWPNGNEARMEFARSPHAQIAVNFKLTENLCGPETGAGFAAVFPYRIDVLGWTWIKHSDPEKVGKRLVYRFNDKRPFIFRAELTNNILVDYPDLQLGLPRDQLNFNDLQWLPGLDKGLSRPFTIDSWMSEGMFFNSETGLMENRIVSGAFGMHLNPTSLTSAEIDQVDYRFNLDAFNSLFIYTGDMVSWQWQNAQGLCQIAFKPSLNQVQAIEELRRFSENTYFSFEPYLYGQDSLLKMARFVKEDFLYVE
jgi:hypothetical protein